MLDINKLRNAYNVIHRMSQNRHPFAEEELSLEAVQSAQVQEALNDAAEVIAVYGKIMNLVSQSTSFKVAPKTSKAVKSSFVVEQDDLSRLQPMTEATNITKLVKYINDTFADKEMHNLTTVELGRWLEHTGYLQLPEDGRNKIPTEKGSELGIVTEKRVRQATGEIYYINFYPQAAQQFHGAFFREVMHAGLFCSGPVNLFHGVLPQNIPLYRFIKHGVHRVVIVPHGAG